MTAPKVIYLQDDGDYDAAFDVTWCHHRIEENDTRYICADAPELVALVKAVKSHVAFMKSTGLGTRHLDGLRAALAAYEEMK